MRGAAAVAGVVLALFPAPAPASETPAAEAAGFSGVTLKFATSSPTPGEVVPETYC